jgi:transcriptional regulator with XRE-family HTH domain
LADYLKVNRNAISRYESGDREPDIDTLVKIANYFKVSIDYLVTGEKNNDNNTKNTIDINNLSPEAQ